MSRSRIAEVTVADLIARGVDTVEASCVKCGDQWLSPITFLPPATTIAKVAALMLCPTCDARDVEVQEHGLPSNRSIQ
jgi:Zn finger protein HypA/HybF involved in hydrogenase expression